MPAVAYMLYRFTVHINIHTSYKDTRSITIIQVKKKNLLLLFKLFIGFLGYIGINRDNHTAFILVSFIHHKHTKVKRIKLLFSVTHKALAIPPIIIMSVTTLAAHNAIRVRRENVCLRPRRRCWRSSDRGRVPRQFRGGARWRWRRHA
jgi:hypothetical protein